MNDLLTRVCGATAMRLGGSATITNDELNQGVDVTLTLSGDKESLTVSARINDDDGEDFDEGDQE